VEHPVVRARNKATLLAWWLSLGAGLSWKKIAMGARVRWIGADISIDDNPNVIIEIPEKYAKELGDEAEAIASKDLVPIRRLRQFAGKCSWAAGIVPALGAMLAPLRAAMADVEEAPAEATTRRSSRGDGGQAPVARVSHALRWIRAFARRKRGALRKVFVPRHLLQPLGAQITTDASPWGYGAVLEVANFPLP